MLIINIYREEADLRILKNSVSVLLTLALLISLFTIIPFSADAAVAVEYIYRWWDADAKEVKQETRTCNEWINIKERSSDDLAPGWYYFDQPTSLSNGERLFVRSGTVNIILKDGKMLDIDEGIGVEPGATLNIFGQAEDSGYLVCGADDPNNAAIGGTIEDENDKNPNAGDINIYGGKVQTGGGYDTCKGAGVGGAAEGSPNRITIYGGNHTFRRYGSGAGIGGGFEGWVSNYTNEGISGEGIRIYGGTIHAESQSGAGIGNGCRANSAPCSIAIYGGNISALSADGGAGIGSGYRGRCPIIHIYNGNVTAVASDSNGESGAGIGGGVYQTFSTFSNNDINIHGGNIVTLAMGGAGIGAGYFTNSGTINITGGNIFACSTGGGAGIGSGYSAKSGTINIQNAVVLASTAGENLDEDSFGAMFDSMKADAGYLMEQNHSIGPSVPQSLPQLVISGIGGIISIASLYSSFGDIDNGAAIGSGDKASADTINIKNSIVVARGGKKAAGIGCGKAVKADFIDSIAGTNTRIGGAYSDINIEGSIVEAKGGEYAAGIGGGEKASAVKNTRIRIFESLVEATGGQEGAGIGSGNEHPNYGTIEIESAIVKAYGGAYGAGIGGGDGGGNGSITIKNESDVKAYAGEDAAGIGGGEGGNGGNITIEDSTVYAEGNYYGAGIGGGEDEGVGTITIHGNSTVTGVGGDNGNARGIGHGAYDSFVSFFTRYYPSNGSLYFPETSLVRIGEDKDHTRVVPASYIYENGRGDETRYISIYPCTHENLEDYSYDYYHGQKCTYCGKKITAEDHIWDSDRICTVCGASALTFTYYFKEQNNNGDELTRSIQIPQFSSFTMPEPENVPDGMEFVGWKGDLTIRYAGDVIDNVKSNNTYTAVYEAVVETNYIDQNGYQQTVLARKFPMVDEAFDLYRGWYVIDEDIPAYFGGHAWLHGDVKLILADDVTVSSVYIGFMEPSYEQSSLSLYGQAKQTGTFSPLYETDYGPFTGFAQYGGRVSNIGHLKVENCKIAGGVFEARSLEVSGKIELGWSRWSDSIRVHSYRYNDTDPEISVIEGKKLKISSLNKVLNPGVLSENQKRSIDNLPLVPAVDYKFKTPPQWTWAEDHTEATATFSGGPESKVEVRANIEKNLNGLYMDSTASVRFMGEIYSDTVQDQARWYVNNGTSAHGTVEISADIAEPGELVEITATPDKNYHVKSVTVTPADSSKEVEIIGDGEAFIMPQCNVTVAVVFEQQDPSPITIHTTGNGTVTANVDAAFEDDEIALNISPDENHLLSEISATCADADDAEKANLTIVDGDGEGNEGYAKLLDGDPATKWCIGITEPRHIIMKADAKVCMTGYSLTTGNDNASNRYKGRNWKDYTIYGANFASDSEAVRDSAQWQVVKAVENDSVTQDVNFTKYDYPLDVPAAPYQYYKIEIKSNKGGSSIQMSEFEMQAAAPQEITLSGEGNTRTFTMPVYPVAVNAVFVPYFNGHSLSLNGDIGINYYLNLTDQDVTDGAKVDFAWTVEGTEKTHSVTLTAANKTSYGYKASCPIAVAEMTYDITATLTIGKKAVATDTYAAVTYANVILNDGAFRTKYIAEKGETKFNQLVTLVQTMLDYGSKAQVRFDRNTEHLANGGNDYFTGEENIPSGAGEMDEHLEDCGLEYVGTSVIYLSKTTLRHYYKIVEPDLFTDEIKSGITFDGEAVNYGEKNNLIYFDKKDIAASQLDTEYVIRINGREYRYSALDYSALSYSSDDKPYSDSIPKQLAAAVYRYNQAANEYFAD